MSLSAWWARIDRVQKSRGFKIGATIGVWALSLSAVIAIWVLAQEAPAESTPLEPSRPKTELIELGPLRVMSLVYDSALAAAREPGGIVGLGLIASAIAGLASALIALGLGVTSFLILFVGWGVAWPLMTIPATAGLGRLLAGVLPLGLAFLAGLQVLRAALTAPTPITAIARNVLNEAVRMKISAVFIVMAIVLLAVIPASLREDQPLRFRVQQWLSYGVGIPELILSLLTVFLAAATVCFEQRDKIIWQTMTKPVAPWQYVLGKWVGVMGLNAVLLGVTATGVFLFAEYLRFQPARGELAYMVREDGAQSTDMASMSEDRRLLESQVLVARVAVNPMPAALTPRTLERMVGFLVADRLRTDSSAADTPELRAQLRSEIEADWRTRIDNAIENTVKEVINRDPSVADTIALRARIERETVEQIEQQARTIEPGFTKIFFFDGLGDARQSKHPLGFTLRFQINAGSNDPSQLYRVVFAINRAPIERQVALKVAQSLSVRSEVISENGELELAVLNGPIDPDAAPPNPRAISFPPDGLQIFYPAGGYEANFFRVMLTIWIKLGFIAAVAIACATFLSFPVAALVSMAIFIMAEGAAYLTESLEFFTNVREPSGALNPMNIAVNVIAGPIAWVFRTYANLNPAESLVEGRLVGWRDVGSALGIIGLWTIGTLALGWAIFRKRELATYSGQ